MPQTRTVNRKLLVLIPFTVGVLAVGMNALLSDPYHSVRSTHEQTIFFKLDQYRLLLSQEDFDQLMERLLCRNKDLISAKTVATYVLTRDLCKYKHLVNEGLASFRQLGAKGPWTAEIKGFYKRRHLIVYNVEGLLFHELTQINTELEKHCP
ncbi:MAG: hypothetical protein AAFQ83_17135 [Bacteroidota bacterium]